MKFVSTKNSGNPFWASNSNLHFCCVSGYHEFSEILGHHEKKKLRLIFQGDVCKENPECNDFPGGPIFNEKPPCAIFHEYSHF